MNRAKFVTLKDAESGKSKKLNWKSLIASFRLDSDLDILIHLEKMAGIEITSVNIVPMTDEFDVEGKYKSYKFEIHMFWGGDIGLVGSNEMPEYILNEIAEHTNSFESVTKAEREEAKKRYSQIAKKNC
jgi:hypothetical protein